MEVALKIEPTGRLTCTLEDDGRSATAAATDAAIGCAQLLGALDWVQQTGYADCEWTDGDGAYRWIFSRDGSALTVVLQWTGAGAATGQHLLRARTRYEEFSTRVREDLARISHWADV